MEALTKSIDNLIDELFADESVEKSMIKDKNPAKDTADEAVNSAPKGEKDEKRDAGRPKQIAEVPQVDTDGKRDSEYDSAIATTESEKGPKKTEDAQVTPPEQMKKSLSDSEFAEYQALKKAKAETEQAEVLAKARKETSDLIKSAVVEATSGLRAENENLRKSLDETAALVKSMANKPQKAKGVTSVAAVEKFQKSSSGSATLSKSELLDIGEDLVKSKKLSMETVIELENTGYIYDSEARGVFEREVARRSK